MSAVRAYYLPGASQLRRFEEQVSDRLRPLVGRWWPEADIALSVHAVENTDSEPRPVRYLARRGEKWLALSGADSAWQAAVEAWLGCRAGGDSDLARALERAFCGDLFRALAADPASMAAPLLLADVEWSQLPAEASARGGGSVSLELRIGEATFAALAGAGLWYEAPPATPTKSASQSCADALQSSAVRLSVQLPTVQIPLVDVATLAVGDFLNLQNDLSGRVQVSGPDLDMTLPATLGCRQGRKAVQLQGAAMNQSRPTEENGKR